MRARAHSFARRFGLSAGAILLCCLTAAGSASAQYDDVEGRLERLERAIQDLQAEIYRDGNVPPPGTAGGMENVPQGKLYDVEASLRQLTGQVEQLTFEIRQLKDRYERFERDTQYRLLTLENGGKPPEGIAPPSDAPSTSGALEAPAAGAAAPPADAPRSLVGPAPTGPTPPPAAGSTDTAALPQGTLGTMEAAPPGTPAEALFNQGMDQLAKAQYAPAQAAFRQLVTEHGDSSYAPQAQFFIADIHFVQKNYREAALAYAEMLKKYPNSERGPDAMLKLGLSLLQLGQRPEGCTTLGAIRSKYPQASDTILNRAQREAKKAGCS